LFQICSRYCVLSFTELHESLLLPKCTRLQKRWGVFKIEVWLSQPHFIYPDHVHHSLCKWLCLLFHKYECICFHFSVIAGQRWPGSNHHPETNSKGRRGDSFYSLHSVCHQKKTRFYLWMLSRKCCDCYFQVTVSYIDEDLPFEDRQALLADYGFKCRCNACLEQDPNKK
jgi:hypothetical protein